MSHNLLCALLLMASACGRGPNSLNGPLAFPVTAEFSTVGRGVAIPSLPGATGIYLLDQSYVADACGSYFFGDNGNTGELAQLVIGIAVGDGGPVQVGSIPVGTSGQGGGFAQVSYFNPAVGDGGWIFGANGSVTITGMDGGIVGSFETTLGGSSLSGSFATPICNPLALDGGSSSL